MSFRFLNNHKFTPFAHRGGSLENKENTLDAFEKCISIGYDYIETDVRETKDGKLVIFHDEDLSRICGLQIKINQLEYKEIKKIKIFDDHHVPLLDEALISWPHLNFNIEPKSTLAAHLLIKSLKSNTKNLDRFCIGSFSTNKIKLLRNSCGDQLCTSMTKQETIMFYLDSVLPFFKNNIPCLQIPMFYFGFQIVSKSFVSHAHSLGKKIHAWTINDESQMNQLIDYGVDGIMTDRPQLLKDVLTKRSLWR